MWPGAKNPPVTGWQDLATDDPARIPHLWTWEMWDAALLPEKASAQDRAARAERIAKIFATPTEKLTPAPFNPGILLGRDPATGEVLMAFDTDKKKGDHALVSREKLFAEEGLPRATYAQETTSGGFHDLYKFALREGLKIRNRTGAREWRSGVEVKGEGGYILGAGAVLIGFDKQTRPYVIGEYRVTQDAPIAELPEAYADDLATKIVTLSAVDEKGEVRVAPDVEADSPANQARVIAFLQKWAPPAIEGEGGRAVMLFQVAHPCADRGCSLRKSAELMLDYWNGEKAFPPFDDDYLVEQVLSLANSRQELVGSKTAEVVFGPNDAESEALTKKIDAQSEARKGAEAADGAKGEKVDGEADAPDPVALPAGLSPVAPFDPSFLPNSVSPFVLDIATRMQIPPDYVGIAVMIALGSVLGRHAALRMSNGWFEHANLWGAIVGRPGDKKSPAIEEALAMLSNLEAEAKKASEPARAAYERACKAHKIKTAAFEKQYQKALEKGEVAELKDAGPEPTPPQKRRYRIIDATYEALGEILVDNPNGVLAYRDELIALLKPLDREENATARGFYLSAWSGKQAYEFDRIGRGNVRIEAACLSVFGTTQPGKLSSYVQKATSDSGNDGMLQRFSLLVWPDERKGDGAFVSRDPDDGARADAEQAFLLADRFGAPDPFGDAASFFDDDGVTYLRFDAEAQAVFEGWYNALERRLRSDEWPSHLREHFSKYRGLVPKLAMIDHVTDGRTGDVGLVSVRKAIAFAAYLETHAVRAYGAGPQGEVEAAKTILAHIKNGGLKREGFTAREIYRARWKGLDKERANLALLWQIFLGKAFLGFLKRVLRDSWVVGVTEGRPWMRPGNSILSGGLRLFSVLFGIRREHGCARFMWRG